MPAGTARTAVLLLKFHSKDLKVKRSNFVFEAATLQAILDPQNRQNRGFFPLRDGKKGRHWNLKLPHKTRPLCGILYQCSEKQRNCENLVKDM